MSTNRQVRRRDSEAFFVRTPVFTLHEFAAALELTLAQARERAKYHLTRGRLRNLERGLYAVVPPGRQPREFEPDRFLVAAAARPDSIFSHHAALELLGVAHSDWNVCTVFTARRRREIVLGTARIRFLSHPTVLARKHREKLATRQLERQGKELLVTGPERTLVEGFRQPREIGGLSELVDSAAGFGVLDLDLLERVLAAYRQRSLSASVGWFLERFRETFFVPEDYLDRLRANRPRSPQYIPRTLRSGVFVSRWNLVLPANVVGRREPDELE
jgi:predicted transcriptional regulator of viral defense system